MEIKHIYWFAYYSLEEPSVRYRAKYPLQELKDKQGITFSIVYPGYNFKNLSNFVCVFFSALFFRKRNSLLVFQKIHSKGMYANALKLLLFFRPQHTLYDIDDADYIRRPAQTMHYFMKKCSACAAGSQSLVEYVKQFNPNTFLLTSPVIDHGYTKEDLAETYTVGWVGYYGAHRQSLMQLFFPALQEINFPLKLTLLGVANREEEQEIANYFKHNKNISVESPLHLDWHNEEAIYERITRFDVGVSPLLDTEFNRAKSAFKLKQCLSCGVPVLGSSVGENKAFLQHGTNGYLCDSPEEFFHQLTSLKHTEHKHYRQLSQYAKESFPAFSLEHYCAELIKIFR